MPGILNVSNPMGFLCAILLCAPLSAQVELAAPQPAGTIHAVNLTVSPRRDVITTVLPFADDAEFRGGPIAVEGGEQCDVQPFGAAWPDGSWRQARVVFPLELLAREQSAIRLMHQAGAPAPSFGISDAVRNGIGGLVVALEVGEQWLVFGPWKPEEDTRLLKAWSFTGRAKQVWAHFEMELGSNREHLRWWLHYGTSDSTDPAPEWPLPRVRLAVVGARVAAHHFPHRVLAVERGETSTVLTLSEAGRWGEGESQARTGVIVMPGAKDLDTVRAEVQVPVLAVADWRGTGAFGPWGVLPPLPEGYGRQQSENDAAAEYNSFENHPWEMPYHGLLRDPSSPGDQRDFSAWVLTDVAQGWPARLYAVHRSVQQEACRPGWYADEQGELVQLSKLRDVHIWSGQVHWTSPNKLGKSISREAGFANPHGFREKDRQHWSINYLNAYALLTADRMALRFAHHQTEQWMAQYPAHSTGHPTIDGMDAARAIGRMFLAASGLELVTGRRDLAAVMDVRVTRAEATWVGRNPSFVHRPVVIDSPSGKQVGGEYWFTMPWQRGYAALGADAWAHVWGSQAAADLARLWAISTVEHGVFQFPESPTWHSAKSVSWDPERPGIWNGWRQYLTGQPNPPISPPGAWNYVEFYDGYMSRMAPAMMIAQREGYTAKDTAAMLRQVGGNDLRTREWRALP